VGYASTLEAEPTAAPEPRLPADLEPDWNAANVRDNLKAKIEGSSTLAELQHHWKAAAADLKRLEADMPPMFLELNAAKDKAKGRLAKEAA
jgi:hypothetical protein